MSEEPRITPQERPGRAPGPMAGGDGPGGAAGGGRRAPGGRETGRGRRAAGRRGTAGGRAGRGPRLDPAAPPAAASAGATDTAADTAHTWNLADLFADDDAFRAARERVRKALPALARWRGTLGESGRQLARALDAFADARRELSRLHAFAVMRSDSDTRVARHQAAREEIEMLWTEMSRHGSFVRPEILALEPELLRGFLHSEPALAPHRHAIEDLMRQREHVLGPAEERILAESGLIAGGPHAVFSLLNNAELPRREVTLSTGETVTLTPSEFARHRTTAHREDRSAVFAGYFSSFAGFRDTLGQNLFQSIKHHVFRGRSRGYGSCLEAALDAENVPAAVYHNLIRQVRASLPVLHRYFRLRARALGLDRLQYHDLYCPLTAGEAQRYTVEQAGQLLRDSLAELGEQYTAALDEALEGRWIDWHPRPGKRSGAYSSGSAYDVHPYVLMNFQGDHDGVSTLAHEIGHALHSHFSNSAQPFPMAGYSIFVAEVASTFNEAMLNGRLFEQAPSFEHKLAILGHYLDGMRGTLFRQTMFAEFELAIHESAERGEALTGEALGERYLELLRDYHGHDAGVVHVDEAYAVEWASIPHFYYDFYVYQYATGIVAATALAEDVRAGRPGARERYLAFLSAGGSDYSLELLRRAGVDLERPEPYAATLVAVERKLDQLERLLDDPPPAG